MTDKLIKCPHCEAEMCYEYDHSSYTQQICFNCGYGSTSHMEKDSDFVQSSREVLPELIKDLEFIDENNIDSIDYFHCDAQGSDLDILKSLNEKISLIKRGQVEGSRNENLYNTENRYNHIIEYLEKNNFIVINKEEIDKKINWKDLNILFVNKKYQTIL
jgi:hypothetical protein